MLLRQILFPFDFSARCKAAVPFVKAVATQFNAKVTLLSVAQPFLFTGMADPAPPIYIAADEVMDELRARVEGALVTEFADLSVTRVAECGEPAAVITDFARQNHVDLIMMPTHGWGPFRRLLLGSVTAKVLHDAGCQVWTAAHVEEPPARSHLPLRNILCAVDGTAQSGALMQWAWQFATATGAELGLVHVIPGMGGLPSHQMDREFEEDMREKAVEEIGRLQRSAGIGASLYITAGYVADGVREEAIRHEADMIVIGRGIKHGTLGRLRTHAYGIIRHSPCPVLSV